MSSGKDRTVVDFDHHSPEHAKDPASAYRRLLTECPAAYSERHGGFWIFPRYEDMAAIARDDATFSSRHDLPNGSTPYTGIVIPPAPNLSIPIETDPPDLKIYRRILNPWFAPAAVEKLRPQIERFTTWCLDRKIETGEIDFILDLANPVPGIATLAFVGLPVEEWESYATPYHDIVAHPPESAGWYHAIAGIMEALARVAEVVAARRRAPRDDLLTALTRETVNDEPLSDETVIAIVNLLLAGGVDTTTALLGHAFDHLHRDREHRRRLIDDPNLIDSACEELLRHSSPTQALARTATRDVEIGGHRIREGERVMLCWAAANRDEAEFERADEVILERFPNKHVAFGLGAHRCLGSNLARLEFRVVMREVLRRMPDYEIVVGAERYESIGIVNGWARMPARFTPGAKLGQGELADVLA